MEFEASLDLYSKIITIGLACTFLYVAAAAILKVKKHASAKSSAILGAAILFSYLYGTQSYVVTDSELIIKQRITEKRISIKDVVDLQVNPPLGMTIRVFGVGGVFGYFGVYYSQVLGFVNLYATQYGSRVVITTKTGEKFLISPDDAHRLAEEIKKRRKKLPLRLMIVYKSL